MANQTITKLVRLIKDLKICIHGIPYITMFTIIKNNILDSKYSMLLVDHAYIMHVLLMIGETN
jgi:hypothetical protein